MHRPPRPPVLLAVFGLLACGASEPPPGSDAGPPEAGASGLSATAQRPPTGGDAEMEAWLAAGHYLDWRCEAVISAPRDVGGHGRHRICSNGALVASSGDGPHPVGAASVKILHGAGDEPLGFAVVLKVAPGEGPFTWYWYERRGDPPGAVKKGAGLPDCAVCHQMAARDYVFFRAP